VQLLCLVYPAYLRADTRRWPQVGQRAPGRGPQLSLLGQLPLRSAEGRLIGLIAQPRGQLPQIVPGRVTVLPDQQSRCRSSIATIATEPIVLDHFTLGPGSVWLDHGVDADLDERAVIFQPAPDYLITH
jgi:hypothetical protein